MSSTRKFCSRIRVSFFAGSIQLIRTKCYFSIASRRRSTRLRRILLNRLSAPFWKDFNRQDAKSMKYSEFLKSVQEGKVSPVVTFLGEERFLKDRALDTLLNRFLDTDSRPFNYRSFVGDEIKDTAFLD